MSRWVFLRGLMRESRHWGDFPELFTRNVPGAEVLLLDLPGSGRLHRLRSPARITGMVECYRNALAKNGTRPPYYLLALSMGAMVASAWAQTYPDELEGCVLMSTSLRPFSPFYWRLRWHNYLAVLRFAFAGGDVPARERLILRLTSNRAKVRETTLPTWVAYQNECPVSRRNALCQLIAAASYRASVQPPRVPILVLAGAADRLVHSACSQHLARAWHTDFALHPEAGHDLPLDAGVWVTQQVYAWLGRR